MRRDRLMLVLALPVTLIGTAARLEAQQDSSDVRVAVETVGRAFATNDPALFDRMTTDDYTFVGPTGAVATKAQRLAPMRSGQLRYTQATYDQITVKTLGSAAVATARVTTQARNGTTDASGVFRATLVFVRTAEGWRMTASHAGPLVP